jgi:hypothetical protein
MSEGLELMSVECAVTSDPLRLIPVALTNKETTKNGIIATACKAFEVRQPEGDIMTTPKLSPSALLIMNVQAHDARDEDGSNFDMGDAKRGLYSAEMLRFGVLEV